VGYHSTHLEMLNCLSAVACTAVIVSVDSYEGSMLEVILQMTGILICGVAWRMVRPAGLGYKETRTVLTTLVYDLLLPALVLSVLWQAELGSHTLFIALAAACGVIAGLILTILPVRVCHTHTSQPVQSFLPSRFRM